MLWVNTCIVANVCLHLSAWVLHPGGRSCPHHSPSVCDLWPQPLNVCISVSVSVSWMCCDLSYFTWVETLWTKMPQAVITHSHTHWRVMGFRGQAEVSPQTRTSNTKHYTHRQTLLINLCFGNTNAAILTALWVTWITNSDCFRGIAKLLTLLFEIILRYLNYFVK